MELLLVRHALPVRRRLDDGPADPELSPEGREQAERLAAYLSGERSVVTLNETAHLRGSGLTMGLFQTSRAQP